MTAIDAGFTLALMVSGGLAIIGVGLAITIHLLNGGR
jgi:hypothetical protein